MLLMHATLHLPCSYKLKYSPSQRTPSIKHLFQSSVAAMMLNYMVCVRQNKTPFVRPTKRMEKVCVGLTLQVRFECRDNSALLKN
jgi:hypothetical protein